jgi:hypothetical protein
MVDSALDASFRFGFRLVGLVASALLFAAFVNKFAKRQATERAEMD